MRSDCWSCLWHDLSLIGNKTQQMKQPRLRVICLYQVSSANATGLPTFCLQLKHVVVSVKPAISKTEPSFPDKDQSQQGPAEWQYFEESVGIYCWGDLEQQPLSWLNALFAFTNWLEGNTLLRQSWDQRRRRGKERMPNGNSRLKSSWLVNVLRPDENIKIVVKCQTLTSGSALFIQS